MVLDWNEERRKYEITDNDKKTLARYDMSEQVVMGTTQRIEGSRQLRPFDRKQPFCRRLGLRLLTILLCAVYAYVALLLLQLTLFNLIFLGVELIYLRKLYSLLHAFELRVDFSYRNGPLKRFIEAENARLYRGKNIELVAGGEGKWLELQFPNAEGELQEQQRIEMLFEGNNAILERMEEDKLSGVEEDLGE